jgi:hypothetical protein
MDAHARSSIGPYAIANSKRKVRYCDEMREGTIYICPMQEYVRLGFYYGGELADPAHLLVGEGKRLRHVKVRTLADACQPALEQLVRAAWVDPQEQTPLRKKAQTAKQRA